MIESPNGYGPYQNVEFPPRVVIYLAHGSAALLTIIGIILFQANSPVPYVIAAVFGLTTNLFLHESLHYLAQSWLGYNPTFELPNKVWTPNEALTVKEGVISLIVPQMLTPIYISLILMTNSDVIGFMVYIAIVFNLSGGLRDIAWVIRRFLWPEGHLVLVDSEGNEFVAYPDSVAIPEPE